MAESSQNNGWVESYLEALLSYGLSTEYSKQPQASNQEKVDADRDKYAKFYVHQILSMGEEGIRDAYRRATSTQHYSENDARLEYLAWRTWFMKQQRSRATSRRKKVAVEDLPDDSIIDDATTSDPDEEHAAEASKAEGAVPRGSRRGSVETAPQGDSPPDSAKAAEAAAAREPKADTAFADMDGGKLGKLRPVKAGRGVDALVDFDVLTPTEEVSEDYDPFANRVDGLYIVLISMHGLIRGQHMELGRDADTGGQVKYVVELARAIATHPAVHRVDLLTRLVQDPKVSPDYGVEEECILKGDGEMGGAYIVRVAAGDSKIYLRKEQLWPHVREFADRGITLVTNTLRRLQEASEPCSLYTIHGHYADAGEVAALMALTMAATEDDVDMVMTGHSLGRNKLEHLLGTMSRDEIESSYKISRRIEGEERALDVAMMVFTSTQQEVNEQWGLYDGFDPKLEPVLRTMRRPGRHMPIMNVVPPGLDFTNLKVDLPVDPNLRELTSAKPAFINTPKDGNSPRSEPGARASLTADGGSCSQPVPSTPDSAICSLTPLRGRGNSLDAGSPQGGRATFSSAPRVPPCPHAPKPLRRAESLPLSYQGNGGSGDHGGGDNGKEGASAAAVAKDGGGQPPAGAPGSLRSQRLSNSMMHMQLHMHPITEETPHIWQEIARFLRNPRKPAILAMSRPDAKKNITTLVNAFGKNSQLRELANLVLIMGNRDNIDSMASGSQKVLTQVMKLIDLHDLYGSVAYPKRHTQNDISDIYLFPFQTHGVFTNIALQEPFGLTVIEAAAHGVPTVATRNGGPVDIMKTLHHGVVVDPTDEEAVAEALLDILHHPAKWDEMSKSGVKNIHAYSWLAHARKYLESIAREKKLSSMRKKFSSRASGNWDHHSHLVDHGDSGRATGGTTPTGMQTPPASAMDRTSTMPAPSATTDFLLRASGKLGSASNLSKEGSGSGMRGLASVSMAAGTGGSAAPVDEVVPRGHTREGFVVVPLDGTFRGEAVGAAIKAVSERVRSAGANVGIGIVTLLGFEDTVKLFKSLKVSPADIDWVVCHGGADIWHAHPQQDGKSIDWKADELWERHIDWRWDLQSLSRLLTKAAVAERLERAGSKRLPLLTNITSMDISHLEKAPKGSHPHHICMELDADAKAALGEATTSKADLPSTAIVDRLRRRLRSKGYRANLTLQMLPADPTLLNRARITSPSLTSCVHVTPLRASRALALRFLSHKFNVDLDRFTVMVVPLAAIAVDAGDALNVSTNTSDLAELTSGLPRVWVAVPDAPDSTINEASLSGSDKVAFEKMKVHLSKKMFGERVCWAEGGDAYAKALPATASS